MGERYYPVESYGLLIFEDDLREWWKTTNKKNGKDEDSPFCYINEYLPDDSYCTVLDANDLSCDIFPINKNGHPSKYPTISIGDNDLFGILEFDETPSLPNAVYPSYKKAMTFLKKTYGEMLPKDFEYEQRFVFCEGIDYS